MCIQLSIFRIVGPHMVNVNTPGGHLTEFWHLNVIPRNCVSKNIETAKMRVLPSFRIYQYSLSFFHT